MKLPRIAGNLLHLVGTPGLMLRYSPGMGVRGFPLTSALFTLQATGPRSIPEHVFIE